MNMYGTPICVSVTIGNWLVHVCGSEGEAAAPQERGVQAHRHLTLVPLWRSLLNLLSSEKEPMEERGSRHGEQRLAQRTAAERGCSRVGARCSFIVHVWIGKIIRVGFPIGRARVHHGVADHVRVLCGGTCAATGGGDWADSRASRPAERVGCSHADAAATLFCCGANVVGRAIRPIRAEVGSGGDALAPTAFLCDAARVDSSGVPSLQHLSVIAMLSQVPMAIATCQNMSMMRRGVFARRWGTKRDWASDWSRGRQTTA